MVVSIGALRAHGAGNADADVQPGHAAPPGDVKSLRYKGLRSCGGMSRGGRGLSLVATPCSGWAPVSAGGWPCPSGCGPDVRCVRKRAARSGLEPHDGSVAKWVRVAVRTIRWIETTAKTPPTRRTSGRHRSLDAEVS